MAVDLQTTELVAVVVALAGTVPVALTVGAPTGVPRLPSGPLQADHRSLQAGLRSWVERQTGHTLGYVEQLYTFADRERAGAHTRVISVSYLGLTRFDERPSVASAGAPPPGWRAWYEMFPWEDQRQAGSAELLAEIGARLVDWVGAAPPVTAADRQRRCSVAFGWDDRGWSPELCLSRYELMYEAGLVAESPPSARRAEPTARGDLPGQRMLHDHRRILATGMARLRAKLQYRPVVFELMPDEFTLGQLQIAVEALAGTSIHKQNFRRLVEQQELVEETGGRLTGTGGRPAKLVRFRREVQLERQVGGTKLPVPRSR